MLDTVNGPRRWASLEADTSVFSVTSVPLNI
jgi:hypothetical protein